MALRITCMMWVVLGRGHNSTRRRWEKREIWPSTLPSTPPLQAPTLEATIFRIPSPPDMGTPRQEKTNPPRERDLDDARGVRSFFSHTSCVQPKSPPQHPHQGLSREKAQSSRARRQQELQRATRSPPTAGNERAESRTRPQQVLRSPARVCGHRGERKEEPRVVSPERNGIWVDGTLTAPLVPKVREGGAFRQTVEQVTSGSLAQSARQRETKVLAA